MDNIGQKYISHIVIMKYCITKRLFYRQMLLYKLSRTFSLFPCQTLCLQTFSRHRPEKNYYQILKVPYDASTQQIKQNYLELVKKYHPDISKLDQNHIKKINQAYNVLSDPDERKLYDQRKGITPLQDEITHSYQNTHSSQGQSHNTRTPQPSMGKTLLIMFLAGMILTGLLQLLSGRHRRADSSGQGAAYQGQGAGYYGGGSNYEQGNRQNLSRL